MHKLKALMCLERINIGKINGTPFIFCIFVLLGNCDKLVVELCSLCLFLAEQVFPLNNFLKSKEVVEVSKVGEQVLWRLAIYLFEPIIHLL